MRFEVDENRPATFAEEWQGQYDVFSHLEFACGVPSALFLITTRKENGKPNACLHAWSTFSGDGGGFFAVMSGLMQSTHTYRNILRDKEFCINFLNPDYYDRCLKTIEQNDDDTDELAVGGFTAEPAKTIKAPRIREAFLCYECTLETASDLSGKGINAMIVGRVRHAAVEENHDIGTICSSNGFMFYVHSPKHPVTGQGGGSAVTNLQIVKRTD
ncbi:flavin reductase family protein [Caproicibacter sp.]|uniref:flavin reductase family protein n=1 Tax=Caproicibacter sp. TaxID=2814884 RepID=UPI003989256F